MYLAIDLWDKRCWIAIEVEWIILPKMIVDRYKLISELKKIFREYNVDKIIVWLPYDLYWTDLKQLNKTKEYIKKLKLVFKNKEVIWFDERYSSIVAKDLLIQDNINSKYIDDLSACYILESYFKTNKIS